MKLLKSILILGFFVGLLIPNFSLEKFVQKGEALSFERAGLTQPIKNGLRFAFVSFWYKALLYNCNILNRLQSFSNWSAKFGLNLAFAQEEIEKPEGEGIKAPQGIVESQQEVRKEVSPILEIKKIKEDSYSIELRDVDLVDLFRVIAHDYNFNILIDKKVKGKVTASLTNISLEEALETIAQMHNLKLEKKGKVLIIKPNLITRVFLLKHIEAKSLLRAEESVTEGESVQEMRGSEEASMQEATASSEETEGTQEVGSTTSSKEATIYELLSEDGKVLLGIQPNSIMVIDYPENIEKIEAYINMVDKGMASRIFKLKYISAKDIVGVVSKEEEGAEETLEGELKSSSE
ncbi:MAG: hypothetical protein DRP72_01870 [Candidatus Omnitrophota bacterium]|nr:MAG: hypothetical protein DRP72_01870 [Candidatus Omnitrophota bacterium]